MKKNIYLTLLVLLEVQPAHAHVGYNDLGILSNIGDSGTLTKTSFSSYGWVAGADNDLGDSHQVARASGYFKFNLTQALTVNISVTAASVRMDPAFSVYAGLLPDGAHDYDAHDPLSLYGGSLYQASTHDKHPNDPQISHYIPAAYDESGFPAVDPVSGYPILSENPIWNTVDPNGIDLGGLTPAQWYEQNYQPHNGYRDTLNYTSVGGMKFDSESGGWVPANYDSLNGPLEGFSGQFDPFGDWSMANGSGEWSKIYYISSASNTACAGPYCATTTTGGYINPGHFAGNTGLTESLILTLAAGNYTLAVDGEACNVDTSACTGGFRTASVSITAVPLPGAVWLMFSGLLFGFRRSNNRA